MSASEPRWEDTKECELVVAILQLAVDDCRIGKCGEEAAAYLWITQDWRCEAYCTMVGMEYTLFRDGVIAEYGSRCEEAVRRRAELADAALLRWLKRRTNAEDNAWEMMRAQEYSQIKATTERAGNGKDHLWEVWTTNKLKQKCFNTGGIVRPQET